MQHEVDSIDEVEDGLEESLGVYLGLEVRVGHELSRRYSLAGVFVQHHLQNLLAFRRD